MSARIIRINPKQQRSQSRVSKILEIAGELLECRGLDAVTLSDIATQAEITRSSLYRYFPDKNAVIKALAQQHMDRLKQEFDCLFLPEKYGQEEQETSRPQPGETGTTGTGIAAGDNGEQLLGRQQLLTSVDKIIDVYANFYCHQPGFSAVWGAMASIPELQLLDDQELHYHGLVFYRQTRQLFPHVSEAQLKIISTMLPRAVGAVLRLAMSATAEEAKSYIEQAKQMAKAYLLSIFEQQGR
ncbi:TetR family transcriptional regulator [Thalassomonas haliotis]|uniref:TetR/AcrR family transcriptional regulator n=1 Tax=Thalassomonas haliotis TaxID=485448 RepID=A0ABY7VG70_9GAMM|nr:TetR family transcriptional regulator [Thalassomonas haliotis]WDE12707.1 TetR/AcrR family transcriptional regulator [Thalassomonas haliotis]